MPKKTAFAEDTGIPPAPRDPAALFGASVSRRDFLRDAGAIGSVLWAGPGLRRGLTASTGEGLSSADAPSALLLEEMGASQTEGYAGLHWRLLGPFRGGRVDAVSGVPGRPNEFYFGHVNGGVWKSIDAGRVWTPIFDSQPVASIGALWPGRGRTRRCCRRAAGCHPAGRIRVPGLPYVP